MLLTLVDDKPSIFRVYSIVEVISHMDIRIKKL